MVLTAVLWENAKHVLITVLVKDAICYTLGGFQRLLI